MKENYYRIKIKDFDFTLKNAWIRVENVSDDDYTLNIFEFYLESVDHLTFEPKTIFRLSNEYQHINYECEVIKTYDNSLLLKVIGLE